MQDWQDILGDGLAVTLELPIAASDRLPTAPDVAARLLDAIAVLEAEPSRSTDEPAPPELVRLELKIDLLMDLVTTLLANQLPRCVPIHLSNMGMVLPAGLLPTDCACIALYPCQWLAQPLVLALEPQQLRGNWCGVRWQSPDHGLHETLRRWVFRLHRREVARSRLSNDASNATPLTSSAQQDRRR